MNRWIEYRTRLYEILETEIKGLRESQNTPPYYRPERATKNSCRSMTVHCNTLVDYINSWVAAKAISENDASEMRKDVDRILREYTQRADEWLVGKQVGLTTPL